LGIEKEKAYYKMKQDHKDNKDSSISKNILMTFTSRILVILFGIVASVILARVLGPTGKGIYSLIILIPSVIVTVGSFGIEISNVYLLGSKKCKLMDVISMSFIFSVIISIISISLLFLVYHFGFLQDFINLNKINNIYFWLAVFSIFPSFLLLFLNNILLGQQKIKLYNLVNILEKVFFTIIVVVFLIFLSQGVFGAVMSYILSILLVTIFVIWVIRKDTPIQLSFNKSVFIKAIKYGLRGHIGNIAQFLNYRLDMFLIVAFIGPSALGIYTISILIAEKLWLLPTAISTILFSKISSLREVASNKLTSRVARHTIFIMFISSLFLVLISKPLIKGLFGEEFLPSVNPLLILLPGIVALGVSKVFTADFSGRGSPEMGSYASFISLFVNISLNIWLIPLWGISGAAFASTISYTLAMAVTMYEFKITSKEKIKDLLIIKLQDLRDYPKAFNKIKNGTWRINNEKKKED